MSTIQEQFLAASKSHFEAQLAMINSLTAKVFGEAEKIINLNVNVAKATLEDSAAAGQQLLAAKDMQDFLKISASQTQPSAEKALAYSRELAGITAASQKELAKAAEAQLAETSENLSKMIAELTKNAPPGSEGVVEMLKSVVANANAGYDQMLQTTKKAAEALEENVTKATQSFAAAAQKSAAKTGKK
ncbi:TIGR01841 family phasin [Herminiimonas sp. CN]|uniref:TIGR01841 family phasin n=1 Tax=Herminiimonas sp. CN TaxID=1349818 RepID=UPI00047390D8|nr:TIGR01841 family phasin [Herminiimonas sp. CN]